MCYLALALHLLPAKAGRLRRDLRSHMAPCGRQTGHPILFVGTRSARDTLDDVPTLSAPFRPERLLDVVDELFATATA